MIPLGTLQRLSGHEHTEQPPFAGTWDWADVETPCDLAVYITRHCTHCKAIADAFEEGRQIGVDEEIWRRWSSDGLYED